MCSRSAKVITVLFLTAFAGQGCDSSQSEQIDPAAAVQPESRRFFDPLHTGTLRGKVTWRGRTPTVPPLEVLPYPLGGEAFKKKQLRPNPNAPAIDSQTKGVGNAVIFLRGIDPQRSRPWDHGPVKLEQRDCQVRVIQGPGDYATGFVRAGDSVEMVSRDRFFYSLHAGGAAFFTLTFPDPESPLHRTLCDKGIVELTSAAGHFWMRGYLFVDDHPYYTRTQPDGRFVLSEVPAGTYELVCWLPNWKKQRHERDPETAQIVRFFFEPPRECTRSVTIQPDRTAEVTIALSD